MEGTEYNVLPKLNTFIVTITNHRFVFALYCHSMASCAIYVLSTIHSFLSHVFPNRQTLPPPNNHLQDSLHSPLKLRLHLMNKVYLGSTGAR